MAGDHGVAGRVQRALRAEPPGGTAVVVALVAHIHGRLHVRLR